MAGWDTHLRSTTAGAPAQCLAGALYPEPSVAYKLCLVYHGIISTHSTCLHVVHPSNSLHHKWWYPRLWFRSGRCTQRRHLMNVVDMIPMQNMTYLPSGQPTQVPMVMVPATIWFVDVLQRCGLVDLGGVMAFPTQNIGASVWASEVVVY